MPSASLFLIRTNDLFWGSVEVALQALPDVVVADTVDSDGAPARARDLQPTVIITGLDLGGRCTIPLLTAIRAAGLRSKITVLADDFPPDQLDRLRALGVVGYLPCRDLTPTVLHGCLCAVLAGELSVYSHRVGVTVKGQGHTQRTREAMPPALTDRERLVLTGLAAGWTYQQVACQAGLSVRTVKRIVAELATKLDAPSLFVLGAQAHNWALISPQLAALDGFGRTG